MAPTGERRSPFARGAASSLIGPPSRRDLHGRRAGRASSVHPESRPDPQTIPGCEPLIGQKLHPFATACLRYRPSTTAKRGTRGLGREADSRPSNEHTPPREPRRARRPRVARRTGAGRIPRRDAHHPVARGRVAHRGASDRARGSRPGHRYAADRPRPRGASVAARPSALGARREDRGHQRQRACALAEQGDRRRAATVRDRRLRPGNGLPATRCSRPRTGIRRPGRASGSRSSTPASTVDLPGLHGRRRERRA